ncbi:hypothetical protein DFQ26_002969 [Actinomortierella ambigua]|nr:hypothetical protein DFQ26_002969 [Actinomortierella ambigua]
MDPLIGPGRDMAIAAAAEAKRARSAAAATSFISSEAILTRGPEDQAGSDSEAEDGDDDDDDDDDEDDDEGDDEGFDPESNEGIVVIHTKNATPQRAAEQNHVYKEIILQDSDFRERFIKGGGNGGQKINKTNSNVELKHYETGIVVQCQATRSLPQNRKLARRILIARLDEYYNGNLSKRAKKAEKIRNKKRRAARKSAKKYATASKESEEVGDKEARDPSTSTTTTSNTTTTPAAGVCEPLDLSAMTLDDILAMDNKKPSRRKSKK